MLNLYEIINAEVYNYNSSDSLRSWKVYRPYNLRLNDFQTNCGNSPRKFFIHGEKLSKVMTSIKGVNGVYLSEAYRIEMLNIYFKGLQLC